MKIANTPPPACSVCFQTGPDKRYIDFEVAYDGPVIPGSPKVVIDDLIVCERCLESAFTLLDPEGQTAEIERLRALVNRADEDIESKDRMITRQVATINELAEHPIRKRPGGGDIVSLPDELAKEVRRAKRKRQRQSEAQKRAKQEA